MHRVSDAQSVVVALWQAAINDSWHHGYQSGDTRQSQIVIVLKEHQP
jgi:hypothetical protein